MVNNISLGELNQLNKPPNLITNQPSNQLLDLVKNHLVDKSHIKNDVYKFNLTKDDYITLN